MEISGYSWEPQIYTYVYIYILTGIDKGVTAVEEAWQRDVFVGIKAEGYALVEGYPLARWYWTAVPPPERRLDQLGRVVRPDLRVDVHVLVNTASVTRGDSNC